MFSRTPLPAGPQGPTTPRPPRHPTSDPPGSGALLSISRVGVIALLLLAIANGAFLYGLPALTGQRYAWVIALPINAAFLGAGYLAGTVATALVVFKTRSWRSLRMLPLPLVVLSLGLLAATLMHADKFRWEYPLTWIWTIVYATVPFGVLALWVRQERSAPLAPPRSAGLRNVRLASAGLGAVLMAVALGLFVVPDMAADVWPWPLTALLARALGSWYALVATALLVCAWSLRRPVEAVIPYATLLAWSLLLLLLPVLHSGSVQVGAELGLWIAGHVALVVLSASALKVARRTPGGPL